MATDDKNGKIKFREYGFEAFYCRPGKEGAHEKGGVEGEGGRFRRNHLVPMPRVDSVGELNAALARYDAADDARRIGHRPGTVGEDFAFEAGLLGPLPAEAFETGLTVHPRVDRHSRVVVRQSFYSVPVRFIGRTVRVLLRAEEVLAFDGARLVARHERARSRGAQVLCLDHYLEVLTHKPGAFPGARALSQARAQGTFTAEHEQFWAAARAAHGDRDGTRALIEVLLLHRRLPAHAVRAGIRAALSVGTVNPDVVAVEARRAPRTDPAADHDATGRVIVLPSRAHPSTTNELTSGPVSGPVNGPVSGPGAQELARRLAELPGERPVPSLAGYDQLLHGHG